MLNIEHIVGWMFQPEKLEHSIIQRQEAWMPGNVSIWGRCQSNLFIVNMFVGIRSFHPVRSAEAVCRNLPWRFHSDRTNQVIFKLCSQQLHPLQPIENKAPAHLPSWRSQWVSTAGMSMCSSCISTWRILILSVHPVPADDTVGRKPEQSELWSSWLEHRSPPTKGMTTLWKHIVLNGKVVPETAFLLPEECSGCSYNLTTFVQVKHTLSRMNVWEDGFMHVCMLGYVMSAVRRAVCE